MARLLGAFPYGRLAREQGRIYIVRVSPIPYSSTPLLRLGKKQKSLTEQY